MRSCLCDGARLARFFVVLLCLCWLVRISRWDCPKCSVVRARARVCVCVCVCVCDTCIRGRRSVRLGVELFPHCAALQLGFDLLLSFAAWFVLASPPMVHFACSAITCLCLPTVCLVSLALAVLLPCSHPCSRPRSLPPAFPALLVSLTIISSNIPTAASCSPATSACFAPPFLSLSCFLSADASLVSCRRSGQCFVHAAACMLVCTHVRLGVWRCPVTWCGCTQRVSAPNTRNLGSCDFALACDFCSRHTIPRSDQKQQRQSAAQQ